MITQAGIVEPSADGSQDASSNVRVAVRPVGIVRRVIGWFGVVLLVLAVAMCLAIVFQLDRIPQLSMLSFIPLYPFAAVPIIGGLLAIRRKIAVPVGIVLAVWLLQLGGFGLGVGRLFGSHGESLRLVSYNIEDWHGPNKQGFYDLIARVDPHVLALQEVWGPWDKHDHRWDPIRHYEWGDTTARHVGVRDLVPIAYERLDEYGNAVLVEYDSRRFWIASVQFPRGIDSVRAMQFMPTESRMEQGRFAEYLADWLEDKTDVMMVGDFNAAPQSWFIRSLGMRNVWTTHGLGVGGTWKVDLPIVRIDHILVKGRIRAITTDTVYIPDFSNHRGLVFEFSVDDIPATVPTASRDEGADP